MGAHRHRADGAEQRAEPTTGTRSTAVPSRPLPLPPLTGSRGPATGSRGPATGSRRAPGRRDLRWVPVALAIWIASFLAVPAAVLVHAAVSDSSTSVENAAETRTDGGQQPAGEQRPVDDASPGTPSRAAGTGTGTAGAGTGGAETPGAPAAEVVDQAAAPVPATGGGGGGGPTGAPVTGGAQPATVSAAPSPSPVPVGAPNGSGTPSTSTVASTSTSAADPTPAIEAPPAEDQQQLQAPATP